MAGAQMAATTITPIAPVFDLRHVTPFEYV